MRNIILALLASLLALGVSLVGHTQTVVFSLSDDDFYVIPIGCPLKPDRCEANPICDQAKVVDSGDARVIVASDMAGIGGITKSDPDDIQSLVHMLTFADKVDIEGITAGPPRAISVSNNSQSIARINDIISAYGSDRQTLIGNHGGDFPTTGELNAVVKGGSVEYHLINGTNPEANNDAVQHIIKQARCGWHNGDKRPLYLLSWGSSTDFAQAVFNAPDIKKVVRMVAFSRGNNGRFISEPGNTNNSLQCFNYGSSVPSGSVACDGWNYLRSQSDLWWVDFTGPNGPMFLCDTNQINDIRAGGALGSKIIDNFEPPNNEECNPYPGDTLRNGSKDWLKMGDTWTLMFTHNPASQGDNPLGSLGFGEFYQPDPDRPYWQMIRGEFKNRSGVYVDWRARANNL